MGEGVQVSPHAPVWHEHSRGSAAQRLHEPGRQRGRENGDGPLAVKKLLFVVPVVVCSDGVPEIVAVGEFDLHAFEALVATGIEDAAGL